MHVGPEGAGKPPSLAFHVAVFVLLSSINPLSPSSFIKFQKHLKAVHVSGQELEFPGPAPTLAEAPDCHKVLLRGLKARQEAVGEEKQTCQTARHISVMIPIRRVWTQCSTDSVYVFLLGFLNHICKTEAQGEVQKEASFLETEEICTSGPGIYTQLH